MAPPTRLRPHLNDLLQKNLELEHVVADLRHQLTQSSAKWADERKVLGTGCDALMASFAKFRARLDGHPSGSEDSEGEVEHNLDARGQSEGTGEAENAIVGRQANSEPDQRSLVVDDLRERCHSLTAELQVKEEEIEESRKKRAAAEEELQRVQRSLEVQSEQLRAALASAKTDTSIGNTFSPARVLTPDESSAQSPLSKTTSEETLQKLNQSSQEITRLKSLLLQWQKYGSDWKRDAQSARSRASELELRDTELTAQVKTAEEGKALLETEKKEVQRLTSALADQTAALEEQRNTCQDSAKRVQDLEAMVALLRAQLPPEQLASSGTGRSQIAPGPTDPTDTLVPRRDPSPNKRSDLIVLKIPCRSVRRPPEENNASQDERQGQVPTTISIPVGLTPQISIGPLSYSSAEAEMCIHTCNAQPCRNESHSFLWPRKQASLPRHALSANKHRNCTPSCPGHRLLSMSVAEAMKEPRRAKCRPPLEAELALAAEEAKKDFPDQVSEAATGMEPEGDKRRDGPEEPEETEEPGDELAREEDHAYDSEWERWRRESPWVHAAPPSKRRRPASTDGGPKRAKKRKPARVSKP